MKHRQAYRRFLSILIVVTLIASSLIWNSSDTLVYGADENSVQMNENLIPNADFQTDDNNDGVPDHWNFYVGTDWSGANGKLSILADDGVQVQASSIGWNGPWGMQLYTNNFPVEKNTKYLISFDIISNINKTILIKLGEVGNNDTQYLLVENIGLESDSLRHLEFETNVVTKDIAALYFGLGQQGTDAVNAPADISIMNLRMTPITEHLQEVPTLSTLTGKDGSLKYTVGDAPVITFTDNQEWRDAITVIKMNDKVLAADKYNLTAGMLTLDASLFSKESVHKITIEANGYQKTSVSLPIYDNATWTLTWSDEFDGSSLDMSKWSYEHGIQSVATDEAGNIIGKGPSNWGNNEKEYYTEEASTVENGKLVITANKITEADRQKYTDMDNSVSYTSARLRTIQDNQTVLMGTKYGKVEARIKSPKGNGFWPAFWMLPTNSDYGTWAASGELDIMEAIGHQPGHVGGTIHYGMQWPNNQYIGDNYYFPEGEDIGDFHTYTIEWEPGEIRWYVDDILYYVENNWFSKGDNTADNYTYPAPYDTEFYILLNLAVSGYYVGMKEPADSELPATMEVDYVRVYEKDGGYNEDVQEPQNDKDTDFYQAYQYIADSNDGNYIVDADFATLSNIPLEDGANIIPVLGNWNAAINNGAGANGTVGVEDIAGTKYAKIDVTGVGSQAYHIQLIQHVPLAKGYSYKISFDAKSNTSRVIAVAPSGDADQSWRKYDAGITANLTTELKHFETVFTMAYDSDPTARLEMNLGQSTGAVYIGNVRVEKIESTGTDSDMSKKPLANGEQIYNGTFDQGIGRMGYWTLTGATPDTSARSMHAIIADGGSSVSDVTLVQKGIQLLQADSYQFSFQAFAEAAKDIKVLFVSKDGSITYKEAVVSLTTSNTRYNFDMTIPSNQTDMEAQLLFCLGGNDTDVTIDNVSLKRTTNNNLLWEDYNLYPIGNTEFSTSAAGWTIYDHLNGYTTTPATISTVDGKASIATNTIASYENWHKIVQYENAALQKGVKYILKYKMKASIDNQAITVKIEDTNYSPTIDNKENVTTEWQAYEHTFTSSLAAAGSLKFLLTGVSKACDIYIADVILEVVDAPYLRLNQTTASVAVGKTVQLSAAHLINVADRYKTLTWETNNTAIAMVDSNGLVTGKGVGTAVITVKSLTGSYTVCKITVTEAVKPTPEPPTPTPTPTPKPTTTPTPSIPEPAEVSVTEDKVTGQLTAEVIAKPQISVKDNKAEIIITIPDNVILDASQGATEDKPLIVTIALPTGYLLEQLQSKEIDSIAFKIVIPQTIRNNKRIHIADIILKKEILMAAKSQSKNLAIAVTDEKGKVITSWSFTGKNLSLSKENVIDLNLTVDVIPFKNHKEISSMMKNDKNNKQGIILSFAHDTRLPAQAKVKVYIGEQEGLKIGKKVYVYRFNPKNAKLENIKGGYSAKIDKDGYITMDYLLGGDYVVVPKKISNNIRTAYVKQVIVTDKLNIGVGKSAYIKVTLPDTAVLVNSFTDADVSSLPSAAKPMIVSYYSSDKSIASVHLTTGKVTGKKAGKVTVRVEVETDLGAKASYNTTIIVK